jgi:hypothetical protein
MHGIEQWYVAPLNIERSAIAQRLVEHFLALGATGFLLYLYHTGLSTSTFSSQ